MKETGAVSWHCLLAIFMFFIVCLNVSALKIPNRACLNMSAKINAIPTACLDASA